MAKHSKNEDDPIGLTEAFPSVPSSKYHDEEESIGLTEAFSPVASNELDIEALIQEARAAGFNSRKRSRSFKKSKAFEACNGQGASDFESQVDETSNVGEQAFPTVNAQAARTDQTGQLRYRGDDGSDEYPDAFDSLEPHDTGALLFADEPTNVGIEVSARAAAGQQQGGSKDTGKGGKAGKPPLTEQQRHSKRLRITLIIVIVLLIALVGVLGYFMLNVFKETNSLASQQAAEQAGSQEVGILASETTQTTDVSSTAIKKVSVPDLVSLLGLTQDEALVALGRGATTTAESAVEDEGSAIRKNVTIALNDDPADVRSGASTIYLSLNADGYIVEAGYSAATASLGYGSLSFSDAVQNESIIENTLLEAGVTVGEGAVILPEDKSAYTTYDANNKATKESYSFSGTTDLNGKTLEWSSVLLYDYSTANVSGNLNDTIRIIYVYVSDVAALAAPVPEGEQPPAEEAPAA